MIYGLVIVTTLGASTLLATFPTYTECIKEQAMISKGSNSQPQCWPSKSEQDLENKVKEINQTVSNTKVFLK